MFRTKSMYIVWIVLAVAVLFTTFLCKTDYDAGSYILLHIHVETGY